MRTLFVCCYGVTLFLEYLMGGQLVLTLRCSVNVEVWDIHILFWIFPLVKSTTCHNPKRVVVLTMVTQAKTAKVWSSFGCDHSQSQPQIMTSF